MSKSIPQSQSQSDARGGPAAPRDITIRYFAWVREKTGISEERVALTPGIATVKDLVIWLKSRGPEFDNAFQKPEAIRAALDHVHVKPDAALGDAREIGFFPPVTGG
jgi:molybdopterin synthase sulfur carrier subunit